RRRHRALKWSLAVCLALVAAAGGAVAYADHYFADRAAPGATLAGLDVAGQTESELRKTAAALVAGLRFTFTADGETLSNDAKLTGDASQLGVTVDPKAVAADVLSAAKDQPLWRKLNPWTDKPVAVKAEFNAQTVRQFLDAEFISEAQTTSDAAVAFDPEAVAFSVVPAVVGLKTEAEPAIEAMRAHLADTAAPTEVAVKAAPDPPKIDDAAAGAAAAQATEALGRVIGFDNGQDGVRARTYQLPAAVIGGWVAFTPDPARGVIDVSFDQALIAAELPGLLADKVAIAAREHIVMTYPDSDTQIGVVQWGLNGLRMADPAPVAVEVAAALAQGRDAQITVPLETDPFETKQVKPPTNYDEPDGAHWIDVDKSSFTATLYAGTTEVGSYVISIGKPGHDTPSGTFYVYLKYDHQVMRGPASDPYESPTDWVSYFSGGVAFHSAPWNEPNNWRRRVSHGCVNMKTRDAKVVYDFAPIGTKVVVHD
ncbi:MAG: L,D-transpeptidase, partial [Bifidobacteriaceae bacterium]|nr:L,D-transpeptidase [Bifidobacteriaceae bacterium]